MKKRTGYFPPKGSGAGRPCKGLRVLLYILLCVLFLTGCGEKTEEETEAAGKEIKVVLTTGFDKDVLFRIESTSCSVA